MVDRVVIEGARAEALIVKSRGEDVELRADTILLSTGSHGTPPILMRSGVGPLEVLKDLGIPESVVMEGVGRNLHDHPSFYISYKPTDEGWERVVRDLGEDSEYRGQVILRARSPVCQEDLPFDLHLLPSQVPRTLESKHPARVHLSHGGPGLGAGCGLRAGTRMLPQESQPTT